MSDSLEFEIRKSSDIKRSFAIEFIPKDPKAPDYVLASGVVTAFDGETDVTASVIDTAVTSVSGNKLTFRVQAGQNNKVYLVKVTGTMNNGDVESAWGTLIIVDPSVT